MIGKGIIDNQHRENKKNCEKGIYQNEKKEETMLSDKTVLSGKGEKNNVN